MQILASDVNLELESGPDAIEEMMAYLDQRSS